MVTKPPMFVPPPVPPPKAPEIIRKPEVIDALNEAASVQRNPKMKFQNVCATHEDDEAIFYCMDEGVYICEECYKNHKGHKVDYIKNLLAIEFNDWSAMMDHAQSVTKTQIDGNVAQ